MATFQVNQDYPAAPSFSLSPASSVFMGQTKTSHRILDNSTKAFPGIRSVYTVSQKNVYFGICCNFITPTEKCKKCGLHWLLIIESAKLAESGPIKHTNYRTGHVLPFCFTMYGH